MISNKYHNLCINEKELLKECIQKNNETQCFLFACVEKMKP